MVWGAAARSWRRARWRGTACRGPRGGRRARAAASMSRRTPRTPPAPPSTCRDGSGQTQRPGQAGVSGQAFGHGWRGRAFDHQAATLRSGPRTQVDARTHAQAVSAGQIARATQRNAHIVDDDVGLAAQDVEGDLVVVGHALGPGQAPAPAPAPVKRLHPAPAPTARAWPCSHGRGARP